MMTSDDKVGGWVKKGQNHDDVILECPLMFPSNKNMAQHLHRFSVFPLKNFAKHICGY